MQHQTLNRLASYKDKSVMALLIVCMTCDRKVAG